MMLLIDLTEDHRNKMLEMCEVLFPDYEISFGFSEGWGFDFDENGKIIVKDQCTEKEENSGLLTTVFKDGELVRKITLEEIRNRLSI